jgi:aspartyl-tRNA(Asn)/glutamyl-tRNA(Gln) amidotransferase subunit A
MDEIVKKNYYELIDLVDKGEIKGEEAYNAFLNRIDKTDSEIKAYLTVNREYKYEKGEFKGIPIAIKDNISTEGIKTTCGSRFLENYIPPYDATAISRLKKTGGTIIGKTNLDEFAMGSSTENSAFGTTKNPWDTKRVPGGSSGGSAAAVASFQAPVALGSDTGGSVRQPAAFCGIYGLKPTYGRISRYGLVAFASSLDQIGILSRNPKDIAIVLKNIAGVDSMDATSSSIEINDYDNFINIEPSKIKVAVLKFPKESLSSEMKTAYEEYIEFYASKGFIIDEFELKYWKYGLYVYYIIASSEASANLSRYDGVRFGKRAKAFDIETLYLKSREEGFGKEVKRRILMGTYSLSAGFFDEYYMKASKVRAIISNEIKKIFQDYDFIILPTTPEVAFKIGEKTNDPIKMYYSDYFTIPFSLGGFPAINIPFKLNSDGLPIGMQIASNHFKERELLSLSDFIEKEIKFENNILGGIR